MAIKAFSLSTTVVALLSTTSILIACASDPNKEANAANNTELRSESKQLDKNADSRGDQRVQAAEVQRQNTDATSLGTPANKGDAKMTEARDIYRAKANERLEKLDAKIAELKALVDKAGAKATTASHDDLNQVDTQHGLVTRELFNLPNVSNDDFKQVKASIDARLDELDGVVKKTSNEVDKFKKN